MIVRRYLRFLLKTRGTIVEPLSAEQISRLELDLVDAHRRTLPHINPFLSGSNI